MPQRTYRGLLWTLALIGLAADQATKYAIFAWLEHVPSNRYALFQTEPTSRSFEEVPLDDLENGPRGFFLEVWFEKRSGPDGPAVPHVNHGALFGFLGEHKMAANAFFAFVSLAAALGIAIWSRHESAAKDRWLCVSLGLILGGTLGNLWDRLTFSGVRDFLHWHYLFDWAVFNIADCCLVIGASLLMVQAFFAPIAPTEPEGESAKKEEPVGAGVGGSAGNP